MTGKSIQSLLRACREQTYWIYGIKLLYVIHPAEYPETVICSDEMHSVVLKGWEVAVSI